MSFSKSLGEKPFTILFLAVVNKSVRQLLFRIPGQHPDGVEPRVERARRERRIARLFQFRGRLRKSAKVANERNDFARSRHLVRISRNPPVNGSFERNSVPGCQPAFYGYREFLAPPEGRSVIGRFVASIRERGRFTFMAMARLLRDYVFAPDLCQVVERLITHKVAGRSISQPARVFRCCKSSRPSAKSLGSISRWFAFPRMRKGTLTCVTTPPDCRRHIGEFEFSPLSAGIRSYLDS